MRDKHDYIVEKIDVILYWSVMTLNSHHTLGILQWALHQLCLNNTFLLITTLWKKPYIAGHAYIAVFIWKPLT